jgi:hypothetical protein
MMAITPPIGTVCPSLTAMLNIFPAAGDGTETVALSVSISTNDCSFLTTSPTLTKISRTSPDSIPSPNDGSLISVDIMLIMLALKWVAIRFNEGHPSEQDT